MRRHERATLNYAYGGELGRGMFAALCMELALLIVVSHFNTENRMLIWMLTSAGFLGMIIAAFGGVLTAFWRKRNVILGVETVSRLLVIVAAWTASGGWFAVVMALGIAVNAIGTPLVSGIYGANFRSVVRGRAVGRLQAFTVGATALTGAALAWHVERNGIDTFRWLLTGVSIVSLTCSWYASRLPETRRAQGRDVRANLTDFITALTRDYAFLYIEAYWFLVGLCNLWLIPLRVLYLKDAGLSEGQVILATTTTVYTTMVLTVGLWGRVLYRYNFGLLRMSHAVLFIAGILIFFHSDSLLTACIGSAVWGLGLSGGMLSWRLVATFFTTPDRIASYMCAHSFLCGVRGVMGPILALTIYDAFNARFVAYVSVGGLVISVLMLIPFVPVIARRQAALKGHKGEQNQAPALVCEKKV